jgi:hypothetical protein
MPQPDGLTIVRLSVTVLLVFTWTPIAVTIRSRFEPTCVNARVSERV